jgi:hypothetical protein
MARKKQGRRPGGNEGLTNLPQRFDVWQVDARQLQASVREGERTVRPWMTAVVSSSEGFVLAFEVTGDAPSAAEVWQVLLRAMLTPAAGEAHLPTEIQLRHEEWAEVLRPLLESVNVNCTLSEALDQTDDVFEELGGRLEGAGSAGPMPSLLDMPGVTMEAVGSFFDAAALFHQQRPWRRVGERPIRVECSQFESGPWYAVLMGQAGMTAGLVLYDSLETLRRIQEGDLAEEESARMTAALAVVFGAREDLAPADVAAAAEHGWRVDSPDAYPVVYRMEPGLSMRPPLSWELELLEGCLRALPAFVRKKTRRLEPLQIAVPTAGGELPLVLSWVDE